MLLRLEDILKNIIIIIIIINELLTIFLYIYLSNNIYLMSGVITTKPNHENTHTHTRKHITRP